MNSGSATDLYKFLHKRKEINIDNKQFETTKNEANDIFDK